MWDGLEPDKMRDNTEAAELPVRAFCRDAEAREAA